MRIAFDTAPLVRPYPPGVVRATRGLLQGLREHSSLELVELAPAADEGERAWRQLSLPRLARAAGCLGVHSPVSAFPWLGPGRRVQTVHELPWRHGASENADLAHRFWARFGARRADAVLCPTEVVRRDLLAEAPRSSAQVFTCPWGLGLVCTDADKSPKQGERAGRRPYVLAVGAVRRKKNLAACLRALAHLSSAARSSRAASCAPESCGLEAEFDLLVSGPATEDLRADLDLARELGLAERVRAVGPVSDAQLAQLLSDAACVVVLSRSEGFGFPVLEALACGTPVVVSAESAQAEVAGPHGFAVDPEDAAAVAAALRAAIGSPVEERARRERYAAEFTWRRSALQVEELWRRWA